MPCPKSQRTHSDLATQLFPEFFEGLSRLYFEGLVVEATGCLGEPTEKVGLALPASAVNDRNSESRLGISDELVKVQPF
jgi:hypothetical protein